MNTTLEDRLRRHYDERTRDLPARGPGLDAAPELVVVGSRHHRTPASRAVLLVGSAAAAAALGFALVNRTQTDDRDSESAVTSSQPTATTVPVTALAPAVTLPDSGDLADTPITVAGTSPTSWYRLQPDLDITWYGSPTTFCWRTPADSQCTPDTAGGGLLPLVVPTGGGQTLVVISAGAPDDVLDVQLSDGQVVSAPLEADDHIDWQVARFELPDGTTITSVGSAAVAPAEDAAITGATLPPAVGLVDVPVTIPAGSDLNYWRWFADLDISERATADGGTELCWRTPAGTGCVDDSFASPDVGVIPTDGAAIILVRPALVEIVPPPSDPMAPKFMAGPNPTTVTATLSDGSTVTAGVAYGDQFGVGHARVTLPAGVSVDHAVSS